MFIESLRVTNLSSWKDSGWLDLAPDLNLFIGLNNSGKSALLRSLLHPVPNNPHKNAERFRPGELGQPAVQLRINIAVAEIFTRFARIATAPIFPGGSGTNVSTGQLQLEQILNTADGRVTIECERLLGVTTRPAHGASIAQLRDSNQISFNVDLVDGQYKVVGRSGGPENLPSFLEREESESVFYFNPQRLNVARSNMSEQSRLLPDASNLPAVLAYVQGARAPLFAEIEAHVTDIMSGVDRITVVPRGPNFEILSWPVRDTIYPELAFSLDDSGTGVGQLIAILTAVVLSEQSVIVIDEINTFLHATAVKRLIGLLKTTYSKHQYIVSSHSSEVIGSAEASTLYHVTRSGYVSSAKKIGLPDVRRTKEIAGQFGFSMLDVFGYDRVVWVEGPTEELIFPMLLEHAGDGVQSELGFCAVASTSAFSDRRNGRNQVIDIYENAGRRLAPLLKGMAFGLDREGLDDEAVKTLQRSKRKLRFLGRRCLENYLLIPEAIAHVLQEHREAVTFEQVTEELAKLAGDQKYLASGAWNGQLDHDPWLIKVDGARLLSDLFSSLSDHRVEYRKTRDSVSIARAVLSLRAEALDDLLSFVRTLIEIAGRDTPP